ncbi:MAG TPA: GGDEF domain-containing protein [Blastocatellia bacterium]|nr:GGDEF domain-containing protein [Blastocatellia bacterium]
MNNIAAPAGDHWSQEGTASKASSRASFNRQFAIEIERAARYGRICSLAIFDINHLRNANASQGIEAGDRLISEFSTLIHEQLRMSDQAFRYGGDEFVVILPETDFVGASTVAQRICQRAEQICRQSSMPADVRLKYGIASFPQDAAEPKQLFLTADTRLRENKRAV